MANKILTYKIQLYSCLCASFTDFGLIFASCRPHFIYNTCNEEHSITNDHIHKIKHLIKNTIFNEMVAQIGSIKVAECGHLGPYIMTTFILPKSHDLGSETVSSLSQVNLLHLNFQWTEHGGKVQQTFKIFHRLITVNFCDNCPLGPDS